MGSEGQQDIEMSILTALLKGGFCKQLGSMNWSQEDLKKTVLYTVWGSLLGFKFLIV